MFHALEEFDAQNTHTLDHRGLLFPIRDECDRDARMAPRFLFVRVAQGDCFKPAHPLFGFD